MYSCSCLPTSTNPYFLVARLGGQIPDNNKSRAVTEIDEIEERIPVEPLSGLGISRQLRRKRNGGKKNRGGSRGRGRHCPTSDGKKNAAQKRQDQRDERRHKTNPHRTQEEEDRERERKHRHGQNRRSRADPYEPGYGDTKYAKNARERGGTDATGMDLDAIIMLWTGTGHTETDMENMIMTTYMMSIMVREDIHIRCKSEVNIGLVLDICTSTTDKL